MKFKPEFIDALALALPLAISVQRIGCFFAGCCYGKSCELPWAVQYPAYTLPHYHEYKNGLIGTGDIFSLPVHPVQLYEFLGLLVVFALVWSFQKKWKANGSSFIFSMSLYLAVRFVVEFFTAPLAHTNGGAMIGAFNYIQMGICILLFILVPLLVIRERKSKPAKAMDYNVMPSTASILAFFSFSAMLIWLFAGWFQWMELVSILTFFVLASYFTIVHIIRNYSLIRIQVFYISLLVVPFIFMSQTLPGLGKDSVRIRTSKSIGFGFASGDYINSRIISTTTTGAGCDLSILNDTTYFNQKYKLGGMAYNVKKENLTLNRETNYGLNVIAGSQTEKNISDNTSNETPIISFNPYFKYDIRWLGLGFGVHLGELSYTRPDRYESSTESTSSNSNKVETLIFPQLYLRLGQRDLLFLDYHLADQFPSPFPGYVHQLGLGTGFGLKNGTALRAGFSEQGNYVSANLPLKNKFIFEPLLHFHKENHEKNTGKIEFSLGIRFIFDQSEENKPRILKEKK